MLPRPAPAVVTDVRTRLVYDSHLGPAPEFTVELVDGRTGRAAPSRGETVGIYEDRSGTPDPDAIGRRIAGDLAGALGVPLDQAGFDALLAERIDRIGRNNCSALSEAFFAATGGAASLPARRRLPRLCLNVLNGGRHAYTNPVLSDFPEYLLAARSDDVDAAIAAHADLQAVIRERQLSQEKVTVSGLPVNRFATADNRAVIEFLLGIRNELGYADDFDLYIDASGGELVRDGAYELSLTDGRRRTPDEMVEYWLDLEHTYPLVLLEDPLAEDHLDGWRRLTAEASGLGRLVIGDNFYSTDADRIRTGAAEGHANAAVIKPNQAGSVTATREALRACRETGQTTITSHRSVSTESTFLSWVSVAESADLIKIGPLLTDYSSVVRLNELLRLSAPEGAA